MTAQSQIAIDAAAECEISVLGAVVSGQCSPVPREVSRLRPSDFSSPVRQAAWEAVTQLWEQGRAPDEAAILGVWASRAEPLPSKAKAELYSYGDQVFTGANADHWARRVSALAHVRRAVDAIRSAAGSVDYAADAKDIAEKISAAAASAIQTDIDAVKNSTELMVEHCRELDRRWRDRHSQGVLTGFTEIDGMLRGLLPGSVNLYAGRPGMGKTAMALNQAVGCIKSNPEARAMIFSLEMPTQQLVDRLVSAEGNVSSSRIGTGHLQPDDWNRIKGAYERLSVGDRLKISDSLFSIGEIAAEMRLAARDGLDLVVIDYMQLLTGDSREGRREELRKISRTLKLLANDLQCTVIVLAQLNRKCEDRPDKRPMLGDLGECGAFEQDADAVAMLYRDAVYNDAAKPDEAEFILRKNRHGKTGTVPLTWEGAYTRFGSVK